MYIQSARLVRVSLDRFLLGLHVTSSNVDLYLNLLNFRYNSWRLFFLVVVFLFCQLCQHHVTFCLFVNWSFRIASYPSAIPCSPSSMSWCNVALYSLVYYLLWYWGFVICRMLSWTMGCSSLCSPLIILSRDIPLSRYARTDWYVHFKSFSSLYIF